MPNLRQRITTIAAIGALIACFAAGPAAAQKAIRLGTSSVGSSFYVIAIAMSKVIQSHAGINVAVQPLGGSTANVFGLANKNVDFAITNSGSSFDGYNVVPPFKKKVDIRLVMQGSPTLRWLLVRKGAGIKTPADLVGKTISSKRRPLPELDQIMKALIKVFHLPSNKIKQVASVDLGEVDRTFRAGTIDGAMMPFALRQPVAAKLFADNVVAPLIISEADFDKVKADLPDKFSKFQVKANNFENQPDPFWVLMMTTQLTTSAIEPEDVVYKVLKAILGNRDEFMKYHATARDWTLANTLREPKIPFHPGAIRYFKEVGAWTPAMEKEQERLLKK